MLKRSFIAGLLLAFVAIPLSSPAQTPAVTNGLSWLTSTQSADGHWPGVATREFVATATATDALFLLKPASSTYSQGLQWLTEKPVTPTDLLARRIAAAARAGQATAPEVAQLLALRDSSGSWGGASNYCNNILDTALALQALKAANVSDATLFSPALAYLTGAQNLDGGWGFVQGEASNVFTTAIVAAALQQFPQQTILATAGSRAGAWLRAGQNADGGFGAPSTAHESALAVIALAGSGQPQDAAELQALNYLTATQAGNGSWNDDPYATALALKALYLAEHRQPPVPPPAGGTISGILVDALTQQRLAGVAVVLASDPLSNTTSGSDGSFTLRDVPPGSQQVGFTLARYKAVSTPAAVTVNTTTDLGTIPMLSSYSTGSIAGTIKDPAGKPLAGVSIAVSGAWNGSAETGSDGSFSLDYVTPGAVTLTASKAGYQSVSVDGTVYARTTLLFSPRLSTAPSSATTGTLIGRVVSNTFGRDLPIDHLPGETGVTVTLTGGISVEPDPDNGGYFTIPNLEPNTYQVTIGMNGYTGRTFRVVIPAGGTIDLGTIRLELTIEKMTLAGTVTDATTGTPIAGAEVVVVGTSFTGRSDFGGRYAIADIAHPAEINVRAYAPGYASKSYVIRTSPFIQTLNIALTPRDSAQPGPGSVDVTLATDKPSYDKQDVIGLTVNLRNVEATGVAGTLNVRVTDSAGVEVYTSNVELILPTDLTVVQPLSLTLPAAAPGGTYTARAEFLDGTGNLLGGGSKTFSVAATQIAVTPVLPAVLVSGSNTIAFQLVNTGKLAASNGALDVTLRDPDGAVVATATQGFSLAVGESKTLPVTLTLPALKFGTYTLSYARSDATITTAATDLALPNSVIISPLLDKEEHRIRDVAKLQLGLNNAGRFKLEAVTVLVSVPSTGFSSTKTLTLMPGVIPLQYAIPLPESLASGRHVVNIVLTLPEGSVLSSSTAIIIPQSELSFGPLPSQQYVAGAGVSVPLTNNGGVDTTTSYTIELFDDKNNKISSVYGNSLINAGQNVLLDLLLPSSVVSGTYYLQCSARDSNGDRDVFDFKQIAIRGVSAQISLKTSKDIYLDSETLRAETTISASNQNIDNANLNIKIISDIVTNKWWDTSWKYRKSYEINSGTFERDNYPLGIPIDFTKEFTEAGGNGTFDEKSVRVFECNASGDIVREIPSQFDKSVNYEATTNAQGTLYWMLDGKTPAGKIMHFTVYFDSLENGSKPSRNYAAVNATIDNVNDFIMTNGAYIKWGGDVYLSDTSVDLITIFKFDDDGNGDPRNDFDRMQDSGGYDGFIGRGFELGFGESNASISKQGPVFVEINLGSASFRFYKNNKRWVEANRKVCYMAVFSSLFDYAKSKHQNEKYLNTYNVGVWESYYKSTINPGYLAYRISTKNIIFGVIGKGIESFDLGHKTIAHYDKFFSLVGNHEEDKIIWYSDVSGNYDAINTFSDSILNVPGIIASSSENYIPVNSSLTIKEVNAQIDINDGTFTTDVDLDNGLYGKFYVVAKITNEYGQVVAEDSYPFYVANSNAHLVFSTDKSFYKPGETVTITGDAINLTAVDLTDVSLLLKTIADGAGEQTVKDATISIPAQGSYHFSATTSANSDGLVNIVGQLIHANSTLSVVADHYQVATPIVTAILTGPTQVDDNLFTIGLELTNSGILDSTVAVVITDSDNQTVLQSTVTILPSQTSRIQFDRNISHSTTYTIQLSGDLVETLSKNVQYKIKQSLLDINATVTTDKLIYYSNESANLTATIRSNLVIENVTAWLTIIDADNSVLFSDSTLFQVIYPGQTVILNKRFDVGTLQAESYFVDLLILNTQGNVIARSNNTLTVGSITHPSVMLNGMISLDKQTILTGEAVTASFSVNNVGNVDLPVINLALRVVDVDGQNIYQTLDSQVALAMGARIDRNGLLITEGYSARDYLVLLVATIDGVEETLTGSYFRVAGAPTVPALVGPGNGVDVLTVTPELTVSNAADPNDERLRYEYELYADSSLTVPVATVTVEETAGTTRWQAPDLVENQTYYWRVRAFDGYLYGPWMETATFRVNTVDEPPTAPHVSSPADGTAVATMTPTLSLTNAVDPEGATLTYNFRLAADADFSQMVAVQDNVASGTATTAWEVQETLLENGWYFWRAQASDAINVGPWSEVARFQVNTANDAPTAPAIVAPADGALLTTLSADVVAAHSSDPDSSALDYTFEADTTATFDSPQLVRSGPVVAGQETTLWSLDGLLDNTRYVLRVKAGDGLAESPWSPLVGIFVNTANDAPTAPILNNPSHGSGVTSATPTLSVRNAGDLDGDTLTYTFEIYDDAALTSLVTRSDDVVETAAVTSWTSPVAVTENQVYYWRAQAFDGALRSEWMAAAAFLVNTANDAPGAPQLLAPAEGSTLETLSPTLVVANAFDPDSDALSYDFELYQGGALVAVFNGVAQGDGTTSVTLGTALTDRSLYTWRVRAFDGDSYGPWTAMGSFKVQVRQDELAVQIKFVPETLNKRDKGQWVKVDILLPPGYRGQDIDLASIRLAGVVPVDTAAPVTRQDNLATVRFNRSAVSAVLPAGPDVPVTITGRVAGVDFTGVDLIKVLDK